MGNILTYIHKILAHCIENFYRFAACGTGSFYIISDTINFADGASRISVVFQSEETTFVTVAGAIISLGADRTTSAEFYPVVPRAI